jgi:phage terminase large subunit-like protein
MTRAEAKDFVRIATRYAGELVSKKIPACQWTIKACRRQLDDFEKAKSKSFPYRFDKKKASRICEFIELLPHIKGEQRNGMTGAFKLTFRKRITRFENLHKESN